MSTRLFLTSRVTRQAPDGEGGTEPVEGFAIDFARAADGVTAFWGNGTRKQYAELSGGALVSVNTDKSDTVAGAPIAVSSPVPVPDDPDVFALPDLGLDQKLSTLGDPDRQAFSVFFQAIGGNIAWWPVGATLRDVLVKIGLVSRPAGFDLDSFQRFN